MNRMPDNPFTNKPIGLDPFPRKPIDLDELATSAVASALNSHPTFRDGSKDGPRIDLVRRWMDSEWSWRFLPDRRDQRSCGVGEIHIVAESLFDYRISQKYVFTSDDVVLREVLFLDDARGIELRIKPPPTANQAPGFRHAPWHRLADAVLRLGIVDQLGVEEQIVGHHISKVYA